MASVCKLITFDSERDKDILDRLAQSRNASKFIRDACRLAMDEEKISLATILEEIREIKRNGIAISGNGEVKQDEPEDIVANLDALGL